MYLMQLQQKQVRVNNCYFLFTDFSDSIGCTTAIVSARTSKMGIVDNFESGVSIVASRRTTLKNSSRPAHVPVMTPLLGSTGQSMTREAVRARLQSSRAGDGMREPELRNKLILQSSIVHCCDHLTRCL